MFHRGEFLVAQVHEVANLVKILRDCQCSSGLVFPTVIQANNKVCDILANFQARAIEKGKLATPTGGVGE